MTFSIVARSLNEEALNSGMYWGFENRFGAVEDIFSDLVWNPPIDEQLLDSFVLREFEVVSKSFMNVTMRAHRSTPSLVKSFFLRGFALTGMGVLATAGASAGV
jgi:hypothetical protein